MTLARVLIAFAISFALGAICAVSAHLSNVFKHVLNPFIVILRTLPTLAVILLLLVWTNAKTAPVIVTVLVLFPLIYAQINASFEGIGGELKEMAQVYQIPKKERVLKMYIPLVSPDVFSEAGANISLGLKVMISAEVLSNTYKSLGGLMQSARAFLDMPYLSALTLFAVLSGLVLDAGLSQLKRINKKWRSV